LTPDFLALRKRLRLTQGEAAMLFGVDRRSWQNWEAGKPAPGPVKVLAVTLARDPDTVLPIMREASYSAAANPAPPARPRARR